MQWLERLDPDSSHPLWGEHRARYHHAGPFVADKVVLDAACGSGYGAAFLARASARLVVGVDIDADAVAEARVRYRVAHMSFVQADLTKLPLPPAAFDVVTSFETIEHVSDPERVVAEWGRVLRPSGLLMISSPNASLFEDGHSGNPFHRKEFTSEELESLLRPLGPVRMYGQRLRRSSGGALDYSGRPRPPSPSPSGLLGLRRSVFGKLPLVLKDAIWKLVRGVPYYPAAQEFDFVADAHDAYPILLAVVQRDS